VIIDSCSFTFMPGIKPKTQDTRNKKGQTLNFKKSIYHYDRKISREITSFWISEVPSPMVQSLESR